MKTNQTIKQSVKDQIDVHLKTLADNHFPAIITMIAPDGTSFYMNFLVPSAPTPGYNQLPASCYEDMDPRTKIMNTIFAEYDRFRLDNANVKQASKDQIEIEAIEVELSNIGYDLINCSTHRVPTKKIVQLIALSFRYLELRLLT